MTRRIPALEDQVPLVVLHPSDLPPASRSVCLVPVWLDGAYRVRCSMGTAGVCSKHGPHEPHPVDGRPCEPMVDGYCCTHGVYMEPTR